MTPLPRNAKDHKAWLNYWTEQLVAAIAAAVAQPGFVHEDFRLNYAVHCARIAHSRACKVRPSLKKLSN